MAKQQTQPTDAEQADAAQPEPTFEESLAELERIVEELESGELGLSDSLKAYEKGVQHLTRCHQLLEKAERRIEVLSGVDAEGNPLAETFEEHLEDDLDKQAAARSRKRSAGGKRSQGSRSSASRQDDVPRVDDPESLF